MNEKIYLKEMIEADCSEWKYELLEKALENGREKNYEELKKSNLLGRGGAAFPTYIKWEMVKNSKDVILICNADEGEPGTFKDRYIMENNPYLLIESMLIAAYTIDAKDIYIYIRGEYTKAIKLMKEALINSKEAKDLYKEKVGMVPEIHIVAGAGAYVCGDETSLINSIEGRRPSPRIKPPLPIEKGLMNQPTVVNNVETLINIPFIIRDGGELYNSIGVDKSRGTKLISLSGKVKKPGVYEIEMGKITINEIINNLGGGIKGNRAIKFVIPGGISTQMLMGDELDVTVDIESLSKVGTSLGSGAMIVADDTVSSFEVACNIADFFMKETCGTCFPCKEGNRQVYYLLDKIKDHKGEEKYLHLISQITATTSNAARCGLGKSTGNFILSSILKIPEDYYEYL